MKYSGLYFISNPTTNLDAALTIVNTLTQSLETSFQNATRQPPWSLSYRFFRDTIPPNHQAPPGADGKPLPYTHSYQHLLHQSSLAPSRTYIYTQPVAQPEGTVTSIPLRQQDAHVHLLRTSLSALWTPRHVLSVREGAAYTGGLCTIQIGELRATREGPQSGAVSSPGVVVCISTVVGAEDSGVEEDGLDSGYTSMENGDGQAGDVDFEYAQTIIRDCWNALKNGRDLGRGEVREVMMAPIATIKREQEREAAVRTWCDALRLRG